MRMGSGARNRASLRAFIFSARLTSARIAGSNTAVRGAEIEKSADNPITFVCWENYLKDALAQKRCVLTQIVLVRECSNIGIPFCQVGWTHLVLHGQSWLRQQGGPFLTVALPERVGANPSTVVTGSESVVCILCPAPGLRG